MKIKRCLRRINTQHNAFFVAMNSIANLLKFGFRCILRSKTCTFCFNTTSSSIRTVYVPKSVAEAVLELKAHQEAHIHRARSAYQNFDMVIALPDGRPIEHRVIEEAFKKLCFQAGVREVVFHSLRNLSTSLKLQYSGGDIKAVQGDTGHSQSRMVTDTYARTFDETRRNMAGLMENRFFDVLNEKPLPSKSPKEAVMDLMNENPEYAAVLLALAKQMV